jgi:hypothetical protein
LPLLLASSAGASAEQPSTFEESLQELDRQVAALFLPSDTPVSGWSENALLIREIVVAKSGEPQMLFEHDDLMPSLMAWNTAPKALLPAGWYPLTEFSIGSRQKSDDELVTITALSPTLVMAAIGPSRQIGTAECGSASAGAEVVYYRHPTAARDLSGEEMGLLLFMSRYFKRVETVDVCSVTRPVFPGRYRITLFKSDGRLLPALNQKATTATVRPAKELPALLKLKP